MTSTVKTLSFALSLCISLTALTACGPNTTPMSSTNPQQSGAQSGLSLEAQAALASYHDADASFSDTGRLASSGQFKTKLLDGGSGSGSGSVSIGVGASGSTSGGSSSGSSTGSTSGSVGVDANASGSANSGSSNSSSTSGSGSVGVGVNANASGSGSNSTSNGTSSGSGSLGVGVDANAGVSGSSGLSGSSSNGSANGSLGVGVGATGSGSTSGSSNNTSGSGSVGVGVGTNVNANGSSNNSGTGSSSSMLNLGTNLNANAMLDAFNRYNSLDQNRSRFTSNGSVSFDSQGNANVDDSRLASNITSRLNANADLQSMRNSNNSQSSAMATTKIDANSLVRLRNRNFETTGSELGSRTNADGSVTSSFMTRFVGNGTDRSISYASQQQGNARVAANAVLNETGTGFTRTGSRQSGFQADGSAEVMTSVMTTLSNGDKLEVFEDRFTNAQGEGSGFGSFRVTRNDGSSTSGDLRTLVSADGSLTTFFDSDDNNQDFALRSDASGSLSFVGRGSNGSFGDNWSMLDFNTVLNSAIQASSSRSGNRSGTNASAAANTATTLTGSTRSN